MRARHDSFIGAKGAPWQKVQRTVRSLLKARDRETWRWWRSVFFMPVSPAHIQHSTEGRIYSSACNNPKFEGIRRRREAMCLGILVFINMHFISSNCLIIINIIIFIFVSSQTNLIDRILCPCYHMTQLALISSHFTYFLLTDCTTDWCSLISICNAISQEENAVTVSVKLSYLLFWLSSKYQYSV